MLASADNHVMPHPTFEAADTCKVVVLCENALARAQAVHVCEHLLAQFGEDLDFEFGWWKLSRLAESPLAERIRQAAAAADIVIFCVRGGELPAAAATWLDSWAASGAQSEGVLACASTEWPHRCSDNTLSRLQQAAQRLGMDFIRFTPAESPAARLSQVQAPDRCPHDIRHWGLNE